MQARLRESIFGARAKKGGVLVFGSYGTTRKLNVFIFVPGNSDGEPVDL